ncbi:MAG: class I SAM-dependent RNA methyltransferase [Tenericutes bacterium]|nr:class I SAM-dependent RNA methyltransferase [Mycoplasmatota bacterium]
MKIFELIATTTFGLEAIVKRELIELGFEVKKTENGKVTFLSDAQGIAKANIWLRCADRVLLKVGEFKAMTFDELFNKNKNLDWSFFIPKDGKFNVNGKSVKSTLFSISDCQAIVKKSIAENLKEAYNVDWCPETGADYTVLVSVLKDIATLTIDTSGVALHKRGYRINAVTAPLKETLAAALVKLSFWNKDRVLYDTFCGSGTIPIEAAMIGRNIAPGITRDFSSKQWGIIPEAMWKEEVREAYKAIDLDSKIEIIAVDNDKESIEAARENADEAGVADCITFIHNDFKNIKYDNNYGVLISNPPYGERLSEKDEVTELYKEMGIVFNKLDTWSIYVITSYIGFEDVFNRKADRLRKLYNGRIETKYYQFYGTRPPKNFF